MSKASNLAGFAGSITSNNDLNVGIITATSFSGTNVNVSGVVTATSFSGDGSNITNLNVTTFPSGTLMLFQQTAAPTGWTKQTTHNNKALRVVSGAASSGGTTNFTSVFTSRSVSGTVGNTTLTVDQIPSHNHTSATTSSIVRIYDYGASGATAGSTGNTGGGNSHDHSFTGTALDFDVQYVDLIIASKD